MLTEEQGALIGEIVVLLRLGNRGSYDHQDDEDQDRCYPSVIFRFCHRLFPFSPFFPSYLGCYSWPFFFFFGSFHSGTPILQVSPLLSIFFFVPTPDNYYTVVSPGRMVCSLDTPFFLIGFF